MRLASGYWDGRPHPGSVLPCGRDAIFRAPAGPCAVARLGIEIKGCGVAGHRFEPAA